MTPEMQFAQALGSLPTTENEKLASAFEELSIEQLEEVLSKEAMGVPAAPAAGLAGKAGGRAMGAAMPRMAAPAAPAAMGAGGGMMRQASIDFDILSADEVEELLGEVEKTASDRKNHKRNMALGAAAGTIAGGGLAALGIDGKGLGGYGPNAYHKQKLMRRIRYGMRGTKRKALAVALGAAGGAGIGHLLSKHKKKHAMVNADLIGRQLARADFEKTALGGVAGMVGKGINWAMKTPGTTRALWGAGVGAAGGAAKHMMSNDPNSSLLGNMAGGAAIGGAAGGLARMGAQGLVANSRYANVAARRVAGQAKDVTQLNALKKLTPKEMGADAQKAMRERYQAIKADRIKKGLPLTTGQPTAPPVAAAAAPVTAPPPPVTGPTTPPVPPKPQILSSPTATGGTTYRAAPGARFDTPVPDVKLTPVNQAEQAAKKGRKAKPAQPSVGGLQ